METSAREVKLFPITQPLYRTFVFLQFSGQDYKYGNSVLQIILKKEVDIVAQYQEGSEGKEGRG